VSQTLYVKSYLCLGLFFLYKDIVRHCCTHHHGHASWSFPGIGGLGKALRFLSWASAQGECWRHGRRPRSANASRV